MDLYRSTRGSLLSLLPRATKKEKKTCLPRFTVFPLFVRDFIFPRVRYATRASLNYSRLEESCQKGRERIVSHRSSQRRVECDDCTEYLFACKIFAKIIIFENPCTMRLSESKFSFIRLELNGRY